MDQRKQKVEGYFDEIVGDYALLYEETASLAVYPAGPIRLDKAIRMLRQSKPTGSVLDIGCGTGHTALELAKLGYEVVGMDISSQMVRQSRELLDAQDPAIAKRARFEVGDVETIPLPDGSVDAVIALGLIEYLTEDEALVSEIRRVLKPGGVAIIAFRNRLFNLFSLNDYTEREVEEGSYCTLLEEARAEFAKQWPPQATEHYITNLTQQAHALQTRSHPTQTHLSLKPLPIQLRQHTPGEARSAFEDQGFVSHEPVYFHFHPFPPAFQNADAEAYVRLGLAMEKLDHSAIGAVMASAFLVAFDRG